MQKVRGLGLPAHVKARIVKSLHSVGLYGAEVGGIPKTGKLEWPLPDNMWDNALRPGRGRGPTRNLKQLAERLG
eukprot:416215-Amphidinium_carterae.1